MVFRRAVDQPNRWAFRCRANVNGERVAVRTAAGKLFQMTGPATAKLLIPSVGMRCCLGVKEALLDGSRSDESIRRRKG